MIKTQESNTSNPMATGNIPKLLAQLAIPAAIAMGKNDNDLAEKIVANCFTLLFGISILLPNFFSNKVFAVFLAEPVSDILAAAVTTITFFTLFNKILKKEVR